MKRVLITGGSGFVGRNLIHEILRRYPDVDITTLSRSEGAISELLIHCGDSKRLRIELGDIRDVDAVKSAIKGRDTVIHLAAMKRVDLSEAHCQEAASINVLGTMNLLRAFKGETFVLMSTDKAVEPVNCYGATKLVAEKLVGEWAQNASNGKRYMIIRSGNILGSTGSVLDIWKKQIEEINEITVTNPNMMRFYVGVDGVVRLYIAVIEHGENGKLYFTPRGDAIVLRDIVDEVIKKYGNSETRVKYIGLRPGERMEEKMRSSEDINVVAGFEELVDQVPVTVR